MTDFLTKKVINFNAYISVRKADCRVFLPDSFILKPHRLSLILSNSEPLNIVSFTSISIMGLCNVECIERIARYLDISSGKLQVSDKNIIQADIPEYKENLLSIQGFSTIVQALARKSKYSNILGNEKETRALTQQWLEYVITCVNYVDIPANAKRVLNELNMILKDVPYITGTRKTIADIVLYYVLYSIMKKLSHPEKARYVHVSRWFDNIQQEEKLRQELDLISFNLMHLFL
ncbi:eukaryotic translation elongation factor 1 epsilon-1 isoform X2 [Pogonomyrmex barbatus]|uniref:Eukaryotic translation elongation factor 1 epsilon-1 isoform X2 n=1 Tax=Pogonomyrmex barbatus TaxID=144034 RepID=A0A6I9WX81_9HYME|nr:eukaryotic translation elongation factor 1 epsilon-1 isoform X2 [Pogonomyrmex barbatus]